MLTLKKKSEKVKIGVRVYFVYVNSIRKFFRMAKIGQEDTLEFPNISKIGIFGFGKTRSPGFLI